MFISVVIPTYNRLPILRQSLYALENQKTPDFVQGFEIIVVDDGSSDDSLDVFNEYNLKYSKKGIGLPQNKGRMFARKEGVRRAKGKWCLFLNSSIILHHNLFTEYFKII